VFYSLYFLPTPHHKNSEKDERANGWEIKPMFIDHLQRKYGGFNHQITKVPEDKEGEQGLLLRCPDTITNKTSDDENGEQGCGRIKDPF
jgi:hypothetical protein